MKYLSLRVVSPASKLSLYILRFILFSLFFVFTSNYVFANGVTISSKDNSVSAIPIESNNEAILAQSANQRVLQLLNKMQIAIHNLDYQLYFLHYEDDNDPITFKYQHLGSDEQDSGSLLYLEGPAKEIILHDDITSYFQPDSASFSISSSRIIEVFPEVVYNDFEKLSQYYDFILIGKARVANQSSQLIRVISKNRDRYSYVLWIDEKTSLPIRIDLLNLDYELIQQFKVLELNFNFNKKEFANYIKNRDYPILLSIDKQNEKIIDWKLGWLPDGFKEVASYNVNFSNSDIDTRLFSDGVFTFTVNFSEKSSDNSDHVITQGARTIYSVNRENANIIIIGNLPEKTIERIVQNIIVRQP